MLLLHNYVLILLQNLNKVMIIILTDLFNKSSIVEWRKPGVLPLSKRASVPPRLLNRPSPPQTGKSSSLAVVNDYALSTHALLTGLATEIPEPIRANPDFDNLAAAGKCTRHER